MLAGLVRRHGQGPLRRAQLDHYACQALRQGVVNVPRQSGTLFQRRGLVGLVQELCIGNGYGRLVGQPLPEHQIVVPPLGSIIGVGQQQQARHTIAVVEWQRQCRSCRLNGTRQKACCARIALCRLCLH